MCAYWRHVAAAGLMAGSCFHAPAARAWVDATIQSDVITLDVVRDGTATVTHELLLRVRGGPLRTLTLQGVDGDAEPGPGATVGPALGHGEGHAASGLLVNRGDDGSLRLEPENERGMRHGSYLLRFSYRTRTIQRDMQLLDGNNALLRWVGPRFDSGMDLAKVVFRVPSATMAPRPADAELGRFGTVDGQDTSTFIGQVRRGSEKDELELVRLHVARGEPVVWTALASAEAFDVFRPALRALPAAQVAVQGRPRQGRTLFLAAPVVAFVYAVAVLVKWSGFRRAAHMLRVTPRSLVPLPAVPRAVLAGAALSASLLAGAYLRQMLAAAILATLAMLLAAQTTPKPLFRLRPPGRWLPLSPEDAFKPLSRCPFGRWFDAGCWRGLTLFLVLLGGVLVTALLCSRSHLPGAVTLALASSALVPLFFTGRSSELPADAARPQRVLGWLLRRLRRDEALRAVPWARLPDDATAPDELRLLILPRRPREGLIAIEVAAEYRTGPGGSVELPCVVVRAMEGSASHAALPRSVVWTRGRKPQERVAIIRVKLPLRSLLLSLVRSVTQRLSEPEAATAAHSVSRSCSISRGSMQATAKLGSVASPAHAT